MVGSEKDCLGVGPRSPTCHSCRKVGAAPQTCKKGGKSQNRSCHTTKSCRLWHHLWGLEAPHMQMLKNMNYKLFLNRYLYIHLFTHPLTHWDQLKIKTKQQQQPSVYEIAVRYHFLFETCKRAHTHTCASTCMHTLSLTHTEYMTVNYFHSH